MRITISSTMFLVFGAALVFTLLRDEVGRVAVIVFLTGVGVTGGGLMAIMALFQTVGAFGEARTLVGYLEAIIATALVLAVGSSAMLFLMFGGAYLVKLAVP